MHALLHEAFADHPLVGEVRGTALIGALEFVAGKDPADAVRPVAQGRARASPGAASSSA